MNKFAAIALTVLFPAGAGISARTSPASTDKTVTLQGCVAPAQRDGSLAPKAGSTATPDTAMTEANSTEPTSKYILQDATPLTGEATKRTAYSLSGHEAELLKLHGTRVEITGSVMPSATPGHVENYVADGIQRIRVGSVKRIEGSCAAPKK